MTYIRPMKAFSRSSAESCTCSHLFFEYERKLSIVAQEGRWHALRP